MNVDEATEELDLEEVFWRLWAYKFLFVGIIFICVSYSVYFIGKAERIYSSSSIFIPKSGNASNDIASMAISSFGGLGKLSGMSFGTSTAEELIETFTGREFVLEVAADLNLKNDTFFNNYDPKNSKPLWKEKVKSLINWKSSPVDQKTMSDWNVLDNFAKNVEMTPTQGGAIKVTVQHRNAERAAEISNYIVTKALKDLKSEENKKNKERLDYLSENLATALINYEAAGEKLKRYMLENSTTATASFQAGSILMDQLRKKQDVAKNQLSTLNVLITYAKQRSPTFEDYELLRKTYPLLDNFGFRRILGISEIISAWSWPSLETLIAVRNSIQDRKNTLGVEILKLEGESKRYATSAEELLKLKREVKISESVYKVLIEQVKSQSLAAGFTPNTSKIISSAVAAVTASRPQKTILLATALVLGFIASCFLALVLSWKKGAVYSRGALIRAINPKFNHKVNSLSRYRSSNLAGIQEKLIKKPAPWIKQVLLEHAANQVMPSAVVIDTTNSDNASMIGRLLGASAAELQLSVAYFDFSKTSGNKNSKQDNHFPETNTYLEAAESIKGCTEFNYKGGKNNLDWIFSKSFQENIDMLTKQYDIVVMSVKLVDLSILISSGKISKNNFIIHASKGKTKYSGIRLLNNQGNIVSAILS